ncbi:hypothetical protein PP301_gp034 [Gordonia phage GMA2]|uniref:Uncharacterized protein n=1 Tax=Gordonia phage GMA2 TaxID=1647283 RepID=A0A0K0N756_9CAUD|nr:hypothetical protein PP301_gp034 [Gordonia phage GMA2]AKJ72572.1 hypothetical protein GMA2_34 [Gordonia phage GMA2]
MIISFPPAAIAGFLRQKMNRSGGTTPVGNVKINGMVSDATYPANVVSDELAVSGAGKAIIRGTFTTSNSFDGISANLYANGSDLGQLSRGGTASGSLDVYRPMVDGDRVWLQANNGSGGNITAAAVELIPVSPITLDTWVEYSAGTSFSITTQANATLVIFCYNNTADTSYTMNIDGQAATKLTNDQHNIFTKSGLSAGSHLISVNGSLGSFRQFVAVSLLGVTTVSQQQKTNFGTTSSPWSISAWGSGQKILSALCPGMRPFSYSSTTADSFIGSSTGVSGHNRTLGVFLNSESSFSVSWPSNQNGYAWTVWLA